LVFDENLSSKYNPKKVAKLDYNWIRYPAEPLLLRSNEHQRFKLYWECSDAFVEMLHREKSIEIQTTMEKLWGPEKISQLYIHGPAGVGKSHLLFEAVKNMRENNKIRVIYIPDCSGWALTMPSLFNTCMFLLDAISFAFAVDGLQIQHINEKEDHYQIVIDVLNMVALYCQEKELQLYAIFDQHNALVKLLDIFPFNVPHRILLSLENWKKNCAVIISASANNGYHLETFKSQWKILTINQGFSDLEVEYWINFKKLSDINIDELKEVTNRIPYEFYKFLEITQDIESTVAIDRIGKYKIESNEAVTKSTKMFLQRIRDHR